MLSNFCPRAAPAKEGDKLLSNPGDIPPIGHAALEVARKAYLKAQGAERQRRKRERDRAAQMPAKRDTPERDKGEAPSMQTVKDGSVTVTPVTQTNGNRAETPEASTPSIAQVPLKVTPKKGGPPRGYAACGRIWTPENIELWKSALLVHLGEGKSLSAFLRDHPDGPTRTTWNDWVDRDAIFARNYTRARENGADALADTILETSAAVANAGREDSARVNAARLHVDALKWVASKLKPRTYADRTETVTSGTVEHVHLIDDEARAKALASIMARRAIADAPNMSVAQRLIEGIAVDVTPGAVNESVTPSNTDG